MAVGPMISQLFKMDVDVDVDTDFANFNSSLMGKESVLLDRSILSQYSDKSDFLTSIVSKESSVYDMAQVVVCITSCREKMERHFDEALTESSDSTDPLFPYIQMRIFVEYCLQEVLAAVERTAHGKFDTSPVLDKWHGIAAKMNRLVMVTKDKYTFEEILVGLGHTSMEFEDPEMVKLRLYEPNSQEFAGLSFPFNTVEIQVLDRCTSKF